MNAASATQRPREVVEALVRDYLTFLCMIVYYAVVLSLGTILHRLDRRFHTGLVERMIRLVEAIDRA